MLQLCYYTPLDFLFFFFFLNNNPWISSWINPWITDMIKKIKKNKVSGVYFLTEFFECVFYSQRRMSRCLLPRAESKTGKNTLKKWDETEWVIQVNLPKMTTKKTALFQKDHCTDFKKKVHQIRPSLHKGHNIQLQKF